jgi:hypothetical protein
MKKRSVIAALWLAAALLVLVPITIVAQQNATIAIEGDLSKPLTLAAADLSTMTRITVSIGSMSYQGVLLGDIMKRAGAPTGSNLRGKALTTYVLVTAADGYQVVFSLGELDATVTNHQIVVADSSEGKPLSETEGPFRLVIPEDKIGARSVRMLRRIQVVQLTK